MTLRQRLGSILTFANKPQIPNLGQIQEELGNKFFGILDNTFKGRLEDPSNSLLTKDNVDDLVSKYVKRNVLIATASSAIPGPLAIFSAIPELVSTLGNQMSMTYDMGCAYDKEQALSKDILLDVPIAAFGGNVDFAALKSGKNLLESPSTALLNKAKSLGQNMVEKHLKKSVIKFVPLGGPVVMAYFAKRNTKKIAKVSTGLFGDDTSFLPKKETYTAKTASLLEVEKIKICIDLIDSDGDIDEREIAFIKPMIEGADIPYNQKQQLLKDAQDYNSQLSINYDLFADYPNEAERFLEDLVLLAMRDEVFKPIERSYILEFCQFVGLERNIALDMINDVN